MKIRFSVDREICEVNLPEQIEDIRLLSQDGCSCSVCGAVKVGHHGSCSNPKCSSHHLVKGKVGYVGNDPELESVLAGSAPAAATSGNPPATAVGCAGCDALPAAGAMCVTCAAAKHAGEAALNGGSGSRDGTLR